MKKQLILALDIKSYANFILQNHINEFTEEYLTRAKEIQLPLLKFFAGYDKHELFEYTKEALVKFLENLSQGKELEEARESVHILKANLLDKRFDISVHDVIQSHHVRKFSLIKLLPLFTNDLELFNSISLELEVYFSKLTEQVFTTSFELNKVKLGKEEEWEKIRATKAELERLINELEGKVNERTNALEKSIEKQNALNLELMNKNQELTKINNDLDNFIYTASHDLKVPICNLEGLIYTLLEMDLEDDLLNIVLMMNRSIEISKNTITALTEISKVQKENNEDEEEINLYEISEEVYLIVKNLIEETNAQIETDFEVMNIKFSKKKFKNILYNLVSNALKYSYGGRRPLITISTRRSEEFIVLSVEDNGVGLKEQDRNKIFKMFKRCHDHIEGVGIGLYMTKRIVDDSEGRIEVESVEGKGSVFKVYFKVA